MMIHDEDNTLEVEYIYPRVVYVLMEREYCENSFHPVGITYVETRAIRWTSENKINRSYLGLEESSIN